MLKYKMKICHVMIKDEGAKMSKKDWVIRNKKHINIKTGTEYDEEGFDYRNFNKEGIYRFTKTKYNCLGLDKDGYDKNGFNTKRIHKETKTEYDLDGFNFKGFNEKGFNKAGFDKHGFDEQELNRAGFNKDGIHRVTKDKYDLDGYDIHGYNKEGFNRKGIFLETQSRYNKDGFDIEGYNETGSKNIKSDDVYDLDGFNKYGYDRNGYDKNGFNIYFKHKDTGTVYNEEGYNYKGYDRHGFDKNGINKKTGTEYNEEGYDKFGYNKEGLNKKGFYRDGFDINGFNKDGIHKVTNTEYNLDGYNKDGYDKEGYNKDGIDRYGKTRKEREEIQHNQTKNYLGLRDKAIKLAKGEMTIEEYVMKSKTSIEDLISFAKKEKLSSDIVKGLYKYRGAYKVYTVPFNKNEYLSSTILEINGEEVKPTEQDVDKCIEYLKANDSLVCNKTIRSTVLKYKRGEIDISEIGEKKENIESKESVDKQKLVKQILNKQKTIAEQQKEIKKLNDHNKEL